MINKEPSKRSKPALRQSRSLDSPPGEPSHVNSSAQQPEERSRILTAALSTDKLLNIDNFRLKVGAYQRDYEWQTDHVRLLLKNLITSYKEHKVNQPKYVLVGNIVLLDVTKSTTTPTKVDEKVMLNWWRRGPKGKPQPQLQPEEVETQARICDIIDGQQRLTTFMMLYHVLYWSLKDKARDQQSGILNVAKSLHQRLCAPSDELSLLKTRDDNFKSIYNFQWRPNMPAVSAIDAERSHLGKIGMVLVQEVKSLLSSSSHLEKFVKFVNEWVHFTVTLTFDVSLAFQTYANLNYTGKPLSPLDVLKAHLVIGSKHLPDRHGVAAAVDKWNSISGVLHKLYKTRLFPGENPVKADEISSWGQIFTPALAGSDVHSRLFSELLMQIRTIHDLVESSSVTLKEGGKLPEPKLAALSGIEGTVEYFATKFRVVKPHEQRNIANIGIQEHPVEFVNDWLIPYSNALLELLDRNEQLNIARKDDIAKNSDVRTWASTSRACLYNLMCIPHTEWRCVALQALKMTRANDKQLGAPGALHAFLLELECLSVHVQLVLGAKTVRDRLTVYRCVLQELWRIQLEIGSMNLNFNYRDKLKDDMVAAVRKAWEYAHALIGAKAEVIQALSSCNLYRVPTMARAVLLIYQHQNMQYEAGYDHVWVGSCTVEHILPQDIAHEVAQANWGEGSASKWTCEDHEVWKHKLGNLILLTRNQNSELGTAAFVRKKAIIEEKKYSRQFETEFKVVNDWNLEQLRARHGKMLDVLKERWHLQAAKAIVKSRGSRRKQGLKQYYLVATGARSRQEHPEDIPLEDNKLYVVGSGNSNEYAGCVTIQLKSGEIDFTHAKLEVVPYKARQRADRSAATATTSKAVKIKDLGSGRTYYDDINIGRNKEKQLPLRKVVLVRFGESDDWEFELQQRPLRTTADDNSIIRPPAPNKGTPDDEAKATDKGQSSAAAPATTTANNNNSNVGKRTNTPQPPRAPKKGTQGDEANATDTGQGSNAAPANANANRNNNDTNSRKRQRAFNTDAQGEEAKASKWQSSSAAPATTANHNTNNNDNNKNSTKRPRALNKGTQDKEAKACDGGQSSNAAPATTANNNNNDNNNNNNVGNNKDNPKRPRAPKKGTQDAEAKATDKRQSSNAAPATTANIDNNNNGNHYNTPQHRRAPTKGTQVDEAKATDNGQSSIAAPATTANAHDNIDSTTTTTNNNVGNQKNSRKRQRPPNKGNFQVCRNSLFSQPCLTLSLCLRIYALPLMSYYAYAHAGAPHRSRKATGCKTELGEGNSGPEPKTAHTDAYDAEGQQASHDTVNALVAYLIKAGYSVEHAHEATNRAAAFLGNIN